MESREDTSNILDPWPTSAAGTEWDGRGLLGLVQQGLDPFGNPFGGKLDTRALFVEIEQCLESTIVDIPLVSYGAHYFVRLPRQRKISADCSLMLISAGLPRCS